jgi:hypothetical protein
VAYMMVLFIAYWQKTNCSIKLHNYGEMGGFFLLNRYIRRCTAETQRAQRRSFRK